MVKTKKTGAAVAKGGIIHADDNTFGKEVRSGNVPVLVDFSASWCGPCRRLGEVLPAIAEKFAGRVKVVKVDIDESPKVTARHRVEAVPTLVVFKGGKRVAETCGFAGQRDTENWLEKALRGPARPASNKPRRPTCCSR